MARVLLTAPKPTVPAIVVAPPMTLITPGKTPPFVTEPMVTGLPVNCAEPLLMEAVEKFSAAWPLKVALETTRLPDPVTGTAKLSVPPENCNVPLLTNVAAQALQTTLPAC